MIKVLLNSAMDECFGRVFKPIDEFSEFDVNSQTKLWTNEIKPTL